MKIRVQALALSSVAALMVFALPANAGSTATQTDDGVIILAQSGGHGGGQGGQGGGGKGGESSGGGHDSGGHESGGHESGGGKGAGGKGGGKAGVSGSETGSGKGAGAGGEGKGGKDGRPNWAGQELVDIGRLNVIRSPEIVLNRSLANLLAEIGTITQLELYSLTAEAFADKLATLDGIIDSPLQNLAVLKEYWEDGTTSLPGVDPASYQDFSAVLIAVAIDKTTVPTADIVLAMATIVGEDMTPEMAELIAAKAADVQEKIVALHDE